MAVLVVLMIGALGLRPWAQNFWASPTPVSATPVSIAPNLSPSPFKPLFLPATATLRPAQATSTPTPSVTPTPALPEAHFILDIRGHHQFFPLGCETAAAKDWANYFGKDFNEFEFQFKLPQSDNPDYGFVGSVYSVWGQVPPYAYGVYAGPVADLLNAYGIPAKAYKSYTLEQLKAKIAADKPVIAWVIGNVVGGVPTEYTDAEGRTTVVAAYEHVVIVTGYDKNHIRYMNNGKFYDTPTDVFLNSWDVLGNMVIVEE
jgi:uncharacterized protein YvpB